MKLVLFIASLCVGFYSLAQQPQQIVINVDRQDFNPVQNASWKVMVGNSSISRAEGNSSRSGDGLGVGIEKMLSQRWSVGAYYANFRTITSEANGRFDRQTGQMVNDEYRENLIGLSAYGKFSFVNFPINKWNQVQIGLLGGVMALSRTEPIYGASASYNYDNLIGIEMNTKVNLKAEASTSANIIGYF